MHMKSAADSPFHPFVVLRLRSIVTCLLLFGLFTLGCGRTETEIVERRIFEQDKDGDGNADLQIETHSRGKTKVFIRMARKLPNGAWSVTHSYLISGKTASIEEDKDGDGLFETLIVVDPSSQDFEVFARQKDGSIVVAPDEVKLAYRRMLQAVDEFWENMPSATDDRAAERLINETKEKIKSAGEDIRQ